MHFRISGVLGDQDAIKTLEQEIIDQLNEEAEEKYKKLLAENAKSSASSTTTLSPPEKITTLSQETLLSKIMERFGAKGTDNKLFHHKAASINDEADNFRFKAKNISQGRLSGKRRYIYTFLSIDGINYIYVLKDDPDHRPDKTKYANPDFNLQNYFEKSKVKANLKAQLLKISNSKVDATKQIEKTADKSDFKALPIETHLFNGELYKLTDDQQKALLTETPCGYLGSAGSGKTLVSDIALDYENNKGNYVVYIEQNDKLRFERETDHRKNYPNCNADFTNYGNLLWSLELKKPENERRRFITKDEYALKIKELIEIINKKGFNLTEQDFIKETRVLFGYDRNEYLALGPKESHFGGNDDKYKINLREALWEAGSNLLDYLDREHLIHPDITQLPKDSLPAIIVDEAQNLTLAQLKSLFYAAKGRNIRFIFDNNQMLLDQMRHKIEFLKKLANKHGITINICHLKENLRSSIPVTNLGNNVLDVVNQLYREGRNSNIEGNPEKKGNIIWLPIKQTHEANLCTLSTNSIDTAVIVLPELIDEAVKKFGKDKVYTVDEIQGLQYKNIILYRMFDGKEYKEEFEFAAKILEQGIPTEKNKDIKAHLIWNHLYTAVTRAEGSVIVYQDFKAKNSHLEPLYTKLRYDRIKNEVTPYVEENVNVLTLVNYTLKNAENCKALAQKLIIEAKAKLLADEPDLISAARLEDKAKLVYREYLNFAGNKLDDNSFESVFKQFSATINLPTQSNITPESNNIKKESDEPTSTSNVYNLHSSTQGDKPNKSLTNAQRKNLAKKRKKKREKEEAKLNLVSDNTQNKHILTASSDVTQNQKPASNVDIKKSQQNDRSHITDETTADIKQTDTDATSTDNQHLISLLNNFNVSNLQKIFNYKDSNAIHHALLVDKITYNNRNDILINHISNNEASSKLFRDVISKSKNLPIVLESYYLLKASFIIAAKCDDKPLIKLLADNCSPQFKYLLAASIARSNYPSEDAKLLRVYLDYFAINYKLSPLLVDATKGKQFEKVKILLHKGCDPKRPDKELKTALHRSVTENDDTGTMLLIANTLLEKDNNLINIKDDKGDTPLTAAIKLNKPDFVKMFLLKASALDDSLYKLPVENIEIKQMLNASRNDGEIINIFMDALKNKHNNVVDFIVNKYPKHVLSIGKLTLLDIYTNEGVSIFVRRFVKSLINEQIRNNDHETLGRFDLAIHLNPNDNNLLTNIYLARSKYYFTNNKCNESFADVTQAVSLATDLEDKADALVRRATAWIDKNNYDQAIADFNDTIQLTKRRELQAASYMGLGNICVKRNNHDQAISYYTKTIEMFSDNKLKLSSIKGRADSYLKLKRYEEALADYQQLIDISNLHFSRIDIFISLIEIYKFKNEIDNLNKCIEFAIKLGPNEEQKIQLLAHINNFQDGYGNSLLHHAVQYKDYAELLLNFNPLEILNLKNKHDETPLDIAIKNQNTLVVKSLLFKNASFKSSVLNNKVNGEIRKMIEAFEDESKIKTVLADACQHNNIEAVDFIFRKYLHHVITIDKSNLHKMLKKLKDDNYLRILQLIKEIIDGFKNEASQFVEQGKYTEAISKLNLALDTCYLTHNLTNYETDLLHFNRAKAFYLSKEYQYAINDYTKAIECSSSDSDKILYYNRRASIYFFINEIDKAINDYSTIIKLPNIKNDIKCSTLINRGKTYFAKGEKSKAYSDFSKINEFNPTDEIKVEMYNRRSDAYLCDKRYNDAIIDVTYAIQLCRKVRVQSETYVELLKTRATANFFMKENDKAIDDLLLAIATTKDNNMKIHLYIKACDVYYVKNDVIKVLNYIEKAFALEPSETQKNQLLQLIFLIDRANANIPEKIDNTDKSNSTDGKTEIQSITAISIFPQAPTSTSEQAVLLCNTSDAKGPKKGLKSE